MDTRPVVVVVGSGITGLAAAYNLAKHGSVRVIVVEAAPQLGGHSLTVPRRVWAKPGEERLGEPSGRGVDVGFQVLNRETYPGLLAAYDDLGVEVIPTDMSFAVSVADADGAGGRHEVRFGSDLSSVLRWFRARPLAVLQFVLSKAKFHRDAWAFLSGSCPPMSLSDLQRTTGGLGDGPSPSGRRYAASLYEQWLLPFVRAVWSSGAQDAEDMDAASLLPFLRNHGFLTWRTFKWLTPRLGSGAEVDAFQRFLAAAGADVRTGVAVTAVETAPDDPANSPTDPAPGSSSTTRGGPHSSRRRRLRVSLRACTAQPATANPLAECAPAGEAAGDVFILADAVVSACNVDVLREIAQPSVPLPPVLRDARQFSVCRSRVVLHRDARVMPANRANWASWNVVQLPAALDPARGLCVTYWAQSLQPVADDELFVSLDPPACVRALWAREMAHPQLARGMAAAQAAVRAWNCKAPRSADGGDDSHGLFVAGAWARYGFHEDGFNAGARAAACALRFLDRPEEAGRVPVHRLASAAQGGPTKVWHYRAATHHAAGSATGFGDAVGDDGRALRGNAFRHETPHVVACDLESAPEFWWGGLVRTDHYGDPAQPLRRTIEAQVQRHLPGAPFASGPVDLVTTLRAFGRAFNPISVFVVWADDWRQTPLAYCLEVTNTPWEERVLYVVDARPAEAEPGPNAGDATLELRATWRKTLHVSPFHPHPAETPQWYSGVFRIHISAAARAAAPPAARAAPAVPLPGQGAGVSPAWVAPFAGFELQLRVHTAEPAPQPGPAAQAFPKGELPPASVFLATWTLRAPTFETPRPVPVAWLTFGRIMRQAVRLAAAGRVLFPHVTLPVAPVDPWLVAAGALLPALLLLVAAALALILPVPAFAAWTLLAGALLLALARQRDAPPLRDVLTGAALASIARVLLAVQ